MSSLSCDSDLLRVHLVAYGFMASFAGYGHACEDISETHVHPGQALEIILPVHIPDRYSSGVNLPLSFSRRAPSP